MEIDARGMACPEPVIKTKNAVETQHPQSLSVVLDNPASQQNVQRFLESQGYQTALEQKGNDYITRGTRSGAPDVQPETTEADTDPGEVKKILVLCATDRMGSGDDVLGRKLMISFIKTLKEMGDELWRLVLVNNGVKLAVQGSPVLEDLLDCEKDRLKILVCGTCLNHFDLLDNKKVGDTTNMLDIVTAMQLADSVITI